MSKSIEELYNIVKTNTAENQQKKLDNARKREKEMDENLETAINDLFNEILEGYQQKIEDASIEGMNQCVIYTYNVNDLIGEYHKKNFLMRGPVYDIGNGNGLNYFMKKGVEPLLTRLKSRFTPFQIRLKFNRKLQTNSLIIFW